MFKIWILGLIPVKLNSLWTYFTLAACAFAQGGPQSGRWELVVTMDKLKVPFTMELELKEGAVSGTLVNGPEKSTSTQGSFNGDKLRLAFNDATLEATLTKGSISGKYGSHAIEGGPYCTCGSEGEAGPDISGSWTFDGGRLVVERKGDDTVAHLLQPEDKTGALTGRFDGLAFLLHHFDGNRAALLEIEPQADGTLDITLKEPRAAARKFRATKAASTR